MIVACAKAAAWQGVAMLAVIAVLVNAEPARVAYVDPIDTTFRAAHGTSRLCSENLKHAILLLRADVLAEPFEDGNELLLRRALFRGVTSELPQRRQRLWARAI